jgi:hypothetical protein
MRGRADVSARNGNGSSDRLAAAEREIERAEAETRRHETNETLRRFYGRTGWEPATTKTPLDELLAATESPKCGHCGAPIESPPELEKWSIRNETTRRLFEFFAQDGLELHHVLRNVYAVGAHMGIAPFSELTVRERGIILGESHGTANNVQQDLTNLLRRKGHHSFKAPGQKNTKSGASYSACQKGNSNRKRKIRSRHKRLKQRQQKIK